MWLPSRDAYSFALQLMDILFTREELASCLLFKSDKPALDQAKVERYVEQKYGDKWDIKMLTAKANQKCCDSKLVIEADRNKKKADSKTLATEEKPCTSASCESDEQDDCYWSTLKLTNCFNCTLNFTL